jgi:hypothetical protein
MKYVDDVNYPQFSSDLACKAAGVDMATLKNWISRKPPAVHIGAEERTTAGTRAHYNFNLRRILQLAITAQLVQLGLAPREASMHALQFTDVSPQRPPIRAMGELFQEDYTFLVIHDTQPGMVTNFKIDETWQTMMHERRGRFLSPKSILLNLNVVDTGVRTAVGLPIAKRPGILMTKRKSDS